jgi:hypothetical protein
MVGSSGTNSCQERPSLAKFIRGSLLFFEAQSLLKKNLRNLSQKWIKEGLSVDQWGLYYKTLPIRILRENDEFCSKLASSGLDKQTN